MNYVTIDTVTEKLGPLWWGNGDAAQAVIRANAWLSARPLRTFEQDLIPDNVMLAGAYLAKLAANGQLYADRAEGLISSKRVKADTVESEKTYVAGHEQGRLGDMDFIEDLLFPYLNKGFAFSAPVIK